MIEILVKFSAIVFDYVKLLIYDVHLINASSQAFYFHSPSNILEHIKKVITIS